MKLLTLNRDGNKHLGVKVEQGIIDIVSALQSHPKEGIATSMEALIEEGEQALANLQQYVEEIKNTGGKHLLKNLRSRGKQRLPVREK